MVSLTRIFSYVCLGCGLAAADAPAVTRAVRALRDLPVVFEPNAGQWNRQVRFAARTGGYHFFLTDRGPVVSFSNPARLLEMSLVGSNRAPSIEGADPLPSRGNYFVGNKRENWRTAVAHYSRVRYREVYPGIDVVYYGNKQQLEYDFVVRPGADPRQIRLKFRGAAQLAVSPAGDLLLEAGGARFVQKKPLIYQESPRREVSGRYRLLARNVVGFELDSYDRTRPVTIDPVLMYATLAGGSGQDAVTGIQIDASGMVYVTGYLQNNDIASTGDAYQPASAGRADIFVAKIDPKESGAASLVYFTYIGGTGDDIPNAMVLDTFGGLCITGSTTSTDFPINGATPPQTSSGGGKDAFALKLKTSLGGSEGLIYSTYLGGAADDSGNAIAVDAVAGAMYVAGITASENFPITASAYQLARWGPQDAFITKLDLNVSPSMVYSSYYGGDSFDDGRAIAVTPAGNTVYLAGSTLSASFSLAGLPYQDVLWGGEDIYIARFNLNNSGSDSLSYATYFGGGSVEEVRKIMLDPAGRLVMTGYTLSAAFPVTADAAQPQLNGNADIFVTWLDFSAPTRDQMVVYSTFLGGKGGDVAHDMAMDSVGNVYLTGYTLSSDYPVTADALQGTYGEGVEAFLTKLHPANGLLYSTYLGQTGINMGNAVGAADDGTISVGGQTNLRNIKATDGGAQTAYGGGLSDGFVVVLK